MNRPAVIAMSLMVLLCVILSGCGSQRNVYLYQDYVREGWQRAVASDPTLWKSHADHWFLTGDANKLEEMNKHAPLTAAISSMSVAVPSFHTIKVSGGFTTQIYGATHDSVEVYGPNAGVSSISVDVLGDTLYVRAHPDARPAITKTIVRIGINHLHHLIQMGCGPIDVLQITSKQLDIVSTPGSSGTIYLSGHVKLTSVRAFGGGSIYVFGVDSRNVSIVTAGCGDVNLWGNVGIRRINHCGMNDINIIGANSPSLSIYASGAGKVSVKGFVRLKRVEARQHARVYVSQSASSRVDAHAYDCATIGLAGSVGILNVDTHQVSRFYGRGFCAQNIYATSTDTSHMNITACNKAYTRAYDYSSIYFFGPDYLVTRFEKGHGVVVSMNERNWCNMASEYRGYDYTDAHQQRSACFVGAG